MDAYLGIDGGGSCTRALICTEGGLVLGYGESGGCNPNHVGEAGLREALVAAVGQAAGTAGLPAHGFASAFLGIAGAGGASNRAMVESVARDLGLAATECTGVDHDLRIAHSGGFAGAPGIVLIAGTGSSCYGRDGSGHSHQCGGRGYLVDDIGGGGWMGRRALEIAVRQADGRNEPGELLDAAFRHFGITAMDTFTERVYQPVLKPADLATFVPVLFELAERGDAVARQIMEEARAGLVELVEVTARVLGLRDPTIILSGGIARSPEMRPKLEMAIRAAVPGARAQAPVLPPVGGAALEALRLRGIGVTEGIIEALAHVLRD